MKRKGCHSNTMNVSHTYTHKHARARLSLMLQEDQLVYDSKPFFCDPSVTKRQMNLLSANSEVLKAMFD